MKHYNVISFSLWGTRERYLWRAVHSAQVIASWCTNWRARFHVPDPDCQDTVPNAVVNRLIEEGAEIQRAGMNLDRSAAFWRYWPLGEEDIPRVIVLDADKVAGDWLRQAIQFWTASGLPFFRMLDQDGLCRSALAAAKAGRDIHDLGFPADAGLIGAVAGTCGNVRQKIADFRQANRGLAYRFDDQEFMKRLVPKDRSAIWTGDTGKVDLAHGTGKVSRRRCTEGQILAEIDPVYRMARCATASECGKPCGDWVKGPGKNDNWCHGTGKSPVRLDDAWVSRSWRCPRGLY